MSSDLEEPLSGGNVSSEVVRIGDSVRRPTGPWTPTVHAFLRHLEKVGFRGAPRVLGIDQKEREILEFIPGVVPWPGSHHKYLGSEAAMQKVGRLLRDLHDAAATFDIPSGAEWRDPEREEDARAFIDERGTIVCHNDPTAWNLVIGGERWALIDWDFAGPRPFIWDVAYALIGLLPVARDASSLGWSEPVPFERRLRAFAAGYELQHRDRARLVDVLIARITSSYEHLRQCAQEKIEPWSTLWDEGHGEGWADMRDLATERRSEWDSALA